MKSTGRKTSAQTPLFEQLRALFFPVLLLVTGVVLCFVPLFNLLGYESSLVLAIVGSLAGVRQGVVVVRRARAARSGIKRVADEGGYLAQILSLYLRALFAAELLLVPPLLLLLLNSLRVRNCSYAAGFGFFAMMPVLSVACAVAVGLFAGLASSRRHVGRALAAGYGVIVLSILWALFRFVATPAIYAYDPFFGYFPGALYDEEVAITSAFFAARGLHLLCIFTLLSCAAALLSRDGDELGLKLRFNRPRHALWGLTLVFLGGAFALYRQGGRLGIYTDTAALNRYLSVEDRTPSGHIAVRYRPGGAVARDHELLLREHALRYEQLRELLGVEPDWRTSGVFGWLLRRLGIEPEGPRVVSYFFDSVEEKRRWMGASNTYIAKPWRRELYLQNEAWPHPVLRHELAHVFAGAAGDRLLRLSMRDGLPRPGMIEGLAVAADFRASGELDGHQVVLAMRKAGLEPPLEQVFSGLAFYRLPSRRAYAIAGSFCRYLLDRYGAAPLLLTYHKGGAPADFTAAFSVPFGALRDDWHRFIDEQPLKPESSEVARDRLRHKAVFHKVCAHELALRKQDAYAAAARGDFAAAERLLSAVCRDDPAEPLHLAERLDLLIEGRKLSDAEPVAQALLAHPQSTPVLIARAQARLGDLAVRRGDFQTARGFYEQAQKGPEPESSARLTTAKLVALSSEQAGPLLLRVLVGPIAGAGKNPSLTPARERSEALSVYSLEQAIALEPSLGLTHYILGRLLYDRGGYAEAEKELGRSAELGLPDGRFEEQALLLRGQAALLSDQAAAAEALFSTLLDRIPRTEQGKRLEALELRDRARRWNHLESK